MGLGSEIRDPEKTYSGSRLPDPGVKKAPDPGSGSATLPGCMKFDYNVNYTNYPISRDLFSTNYAQIAHIQCQPGTLAV
jgi:hypothetical protein